MMFCLKNNVATVHHPDTNYCGWFKDIYSENREAFRLCQRLGIKPLIVHESNADNFQELYRVNQYMNHPLVLKVWFEFETEQEAVAFKFACDGLTKNQEPDIL